MKIRFPWELFMLSSCGERMYRLSFLGETETTLDGLPHLPFLEQLSAARKV